LFQVPVANVGKTQLRLFAVSSRFLAGPCALGACWLGRNATMTTSARMDLLVDIGVVYVNS
jgi:hypothetical protein